MKFNKARIENGQIVITESIEVDQNKLTSNCWEIQIKGLTACNTCELKDTENCGGGKTLKQFHKKLKELKNGKRKIKRRT